jgi:hypothetical protein
MAGPSPRAGAAYEKKESAEYICRASSVAARS